MRTPDRGNSFNRQKTTEARVDNLARHTASLPGREPAGIVPTRQRLVRIENSSYPHNPAHNVVNFSFLDATFTATAGAQTLTLEDRGSDDVVLNLAGREIPDQTVLMVYAYDRDPRWYCWWVPSGENSTHCMSAYMSEDRVDLDGYERLKFDTIDEQHGSLITLDDGSGGFEGMFTFHGVAWVYIVGRMKLTTSGSAAAQTTVGFDLNFDDGMGGLTLADSNGTGWDYVSGLDRSALGFVEVHKLLRTADGDQMAIWGSKSSGDRVDVIGANHGPGGAPVASRLDIYCINPLDVLPS